MYRADLVFLAILMLVGIAILWLTRFFPDTGELFGPAFFPRALAVALLLLTGGLATAWIGAARHARFSRVVLPVGFLRRGALFTFLLIAYIVLLALRTPLGFPGSTALFLLGTGLLFGGRSPAAIISMALGTSLGLYLFFRVWLHVPLPPSVWF